MHSRLLPLNPPQMTTAETLQRFAIPRLTLPSLPWLEFCFFAVMILGLILVGA